MINPYAEIARLRSELDEVTQERDRIIEKIKNTEEAHTRMQQFWRCAHGFHRMDKATRVPTVFTPGYSGKCVRCGAPLRRSLV